MSSLAFAQSSSYQDRVRRYIAQYREFAEMEQKRIGVPAAITLGQGILETQAGQSELATIANNHFGIKCKKEWQGETFAHDDDAPQECFRKYPSALHSYKDHSDYLRTSTRYNSCFACSPTDYASWAKELRKCGYATNPKYASQLIKIIEDFRLQEYTYAAMERKEPALIASSASSVEAAVMAEKSNPGENVPEHDTPAAARSEKTIYGKAVHRDGVRGFYAQKGDVLLEYAIQYKVRYAKLLEINHLPDAPLASDMFVALEKGGRVTQILSRDMSETTVQPAAPTVASVTKETAAPAVLETQVAEVPQVSSEIPAKENNIEVERKVDAGVSDKPEAVAISPEITRSKPESAVVTTSAEPGGKPASDPMASTTSPQSAVAAEKPFNIANETAVEEVKAAPKEEEPKDEFSRLKARFDRVVYATPAPRTTPATTTVVKREAPATATQIPPQSPTVQSAPEFHVVQKGETAFGIAKRYGISMKDLMSMNKLDFEAIKVGQKLRVR